MILRVALLADKKIEKMPHRVSFFWRWQVQQIALLAELFDTSRISLFLMIFPPDIETYCENNYR
jgi:hypothetical protein